MITEFSEKYQVTGIPRSKMMVSGKFTPPTCLFCSTWAEGLVFEPHEVEVLSRQWHNINEMLIVELVHQLVQFLLIEQITRVDFLERPFDVHNFRHFK